MKSIGVIRDMKDELVIAGFFAIFAVIFALVPFIIYLLRRSRAEQCDCQTTATIIDYIRHYGQNNDTFAPVYCYFANGIQYQTESHYSFSKCRHQIGDKVLLYYQSTDPEKIYVEDEQYIVKFLTIVFVILAGVMFLVSIILIVCSF